MNIRAIRRAVALVFVLATSIVRFWLMRLSGPRTLERGAHWVQETCVRVLRSMDVRWEVQGTVPAQGLVVANHLSYLDIVVLSAAMPCFFVAKSEIRLWPFFGRAARVSGTLFIDRTRLESAEKVAARIGERLKLDLPVLFFPEGTSSDGTILRFHSRLFEPAIRAGEPVTAASIRYIPGDGANERELCWYGDAAFAPHLLKLLGMPSFRAKLRFGEPHVYPDRRIAAEATFAEITAMRAGTGEVLQPA